MAGGMNTIVGLGGAGSVAWQQLGMWLVLHSGMYYCTSTTGVHGVISEAGTAATRRRRRERTGMPTGVNRVGLRHSSVRYGGAEFPRRLVCEGNRV